MKKWIEILALMCLMACELTVDVVVPHDPVLHLDAVFFSGESMPVMSLRQSFNGTGSDIFEVPSDQVYLSGATVLLHRNDTPVTVTSVGQGLYRGPENDTVRMGDIFDIIVSHDGRTIQARAQVPDYDLEGIRFSANRVSGPDTFRLQQLADPVIWDTAWVTRVQITAAIPVVPSFLAVDAISSINDELREEYRIHNLGGFQQHKRYFGENFSGIDSLIYTKAFDAYFRWAEKPTGTLFFPVALEVIIPEPIYVDFVNIVSGSLVPVTVTNVENGVGLFIGAIRHVSVKEVPVMFTLE